jgi:putative ABC transport system permease protein
MMTQKKLGTVQIAFRNLWHRPFRSVCLTFAAAIVSFTLFGGAILTASLRNGMDRMKARFGADLMVVPAEYAAAAEAVLLRGEPQAFYFNQGTVQNIAAINGVSRLSPQFYLTSLQDECCTYMVQIIGFDPGTDFVIQPWVAEVRSETIEDGQVIVGSEINITRGMLKLFNHEFPVAAKLRETATGFDSSVFMNMRTLQNLVNTAHNEGYKFLSDNEPDGSISSILIRLDGDASSGRIIREIKESTPGVEVIAGSNIFRGIIESLNGLTAYIRNFAVILWLLAVLVLGAVFSISINERKKEFALLRILGATRKMLISIVLCESSLAALAGAIAGVILAALIVFPFSTYIGDRLQLPFISPRGAAVAFSVLVSVFLSFIVGPLASIFGALRISKAETYYTMREGE